MTVWRAMLRAVPEDSELPADIVPDVGLDALADEIRRAGHRASVMKDKADRAREALRAADAEHEQAEDDVRRTMGRLQTAVVALEDEIREFGGTKGEK
jgi:phytoene/squalene synthetase